MPYGIKSSKNIYQKKMDHIFDKCNAAFIVADDIQVCGNEINHDMHSYEAMERTMQSGLKLNYDKCVIKTKSCNFTGNIYTPQGVVPDQKKTESIKKMKTTQTKQELQFFIGIMNYLGQFI